MLPRNRNDRNDAQNYNRNAGYEERFGSAGQKGSHRYSEFEPESYGAVGSHRPARGDYSAFEGATNRPYYGGEEGSFPYGGSSAHESNTSSYNADERSAARNWRPEGQHTGKGPKGYRRSDERIHEEVSEMLMEHGDIDASEIEVMVNEGVVHLSGSIESRRIKRMAEDLVEQVQGVRDVRNDLQIVSHGSGSKGRSEFADFSALPSERSSERMQSSANSAKSGQRDRSSRTKRNKAAGARQMSQ